MTKQKEFLVFDIGKVIALGDEKPAVDLLIDFGVARKNTGDTFASLEYYEFLLKMKHILVLLYFLLEDI